MWIIWILGVLAALSAICSFVMEYMDQKDKRRRLWGYRVADIRRFTTLAALFLGISTALLELKDKIDDKLEAVDRQTVLLNRLAKIINNTDPIRGSSLQVDWACQDTLCYNFLKEMFTNPHSRILTKYWDPEERTVIDSSARIWLMMGVHLYFLDSTDYKNHKDELFIHDKYDDTETPLLQQLAKCELRADDHFNVLTITDHSEEMTTDGFGEDTDRIDGHYRLYMKYKKNGSQNLGFSNLTDLYCLMTLEEPWPAHQATVEYQCYLYNSDSTKTLIFHFTRASTFRKEDKAEFREYLCKAPELILN